MYCSNCGAKADKDANFCHTCGTELNKRKSLKKNVRPKKVSEAVSMLYITLVMSGLSAIMQLPMHTQTKPVAFVLAVHVFSLGFMWFFIYMIGRGHNWARIFFLILFILSIPFSIAPLLESFAINPIVGMLGIGIIILDIVSLAFLFQTDSSAWFSTL